MPKKTSSENIASLKQEIKEIHSPSSFRIEPGSQSDAGFLDARIVIADKSKKDVVKDKILIFWQDSAEDDEDGLKDKARLEAALKYVKDNPGKRFRFLMPADHWAYATIEFNKASNSVDFLIVDSVPEDKDGAGVNPLIRATTFKRTKDFFSRELNDKVKFNFYYSVEEVQKDSKSCATYALDGVCNLVDLESYIKNENLFHYLERHRVSCQDVIQDMKKWYQVDVKTTLLPIRAIKGKQSLDSKKTNIWNSGIRDEVQRRKDDKEEAQSVNRKNESLETVIQSAGKLKIIGKKKEKMYNRIKKTLERIEDGKIEGIVNNTSIYIENGNTHQPQPIAIDKSGNYFAKKLKNPIVKELEENKNLVSNESQKILDNQAIDLQVHQTTYKLWFEFEGKIKDKKIPVGENGYPSFAAVKEALSTLFPGENLDDCKLYDDDECLIENDEELKETLEYGTTSRFTIIDTKKEEALTAISNSQFRFH